MIKTLRRTTAALRLAASALATPASADTDGTPTSATIHADTPGPVYDKRIFTQFAEHLGTGIYGGLWVGNDRSIPNTNGFRNDVVAALRTLSVPVIRWPVMILSPGSRALASRNSTGSPPSASARRSIWASWAKQAWTQPKPRMAPHGGLMVRTATPSICALTTR